MTVNTEVDGEALQEITKCEYLGFCISQEGNYTPEIWRQVAIGMRTLQNVKTLLDYGSKLIKESCEQVFVQQPRTDASPG